MLKWHTQARDITTKLKFRIDCTLSELCATEIMTWNCHVDDPSKGRYYIILGRSYLKEL